MPETGVVRGVRMGSGLSGHLDPFTAAKQVAEQAAADLDGSQGVDLCLLFASAHHARVLGGLGEIIAKTLSPRQLVGVTTESVIGGRVELERQPGVSLLAASLPGVRLHGFDEALLGPADPTNPEQVAVVGGAIGASDDLRCTLVFADAFSVPVLNTLPGLCAARRRGRDGRPIGSIFGGVVSGGRGPGQNALLIDGVVKRSGAVGVSIAGPVRVDTVVSQGCRPIGPNLLVTRSKRNVVFELSGRPAVEVVCEVVESLDERGREQVKRGLFVGRVVNEYKERFGRGDFLIRNVAGADEATGAIALGDAVRTGQTVRLHVRDAATADEDLALLLDAQKLHERPAGALLVTCNGRGSGLFGRPGHDAQAVSRAFAPERAGEERAKGGAPIEPARGSVPLAGMFGAGEIGPVGDESFLHGFSACVALFRDPAP